MHSLSALILRIFVGMVSSMAALFLFSSCVRDNAEDCYQGEQFHLYVKVVDTETGEDITRTGITDEVLIAVFDDQGRFVTTRILDREAVAARTPVTFEDIDPGGLLVSAWGDIGENVHTQDPSGSSIGQGFIRLAENENGYSFSPDDFMFGFKALPTRASRTEEVVVTQKNAKVNVTVRGLADTDPQKYGVVIEAPRNGYDFAGEPDGDPCRVWRTGEFRGNEFVSPDPYLMIHSEENPDGNPSGGVAVRLYEITGADYGLIASAESDADGKPIVLPSGKTTNILMDLSAGSLDIRIEVTGWREVYQWPQW